MTSRCEVWDLDHPEDGWHAVKDVRFTYTLADLRTGGLVYARPVVGARKPNVERKAPRRG